MNAHPSTEEFKGERREQGAGRPSPVTDQLHFLCTTATLAEREEKIRESWVRTMEARIVREELQKCYKAEGVNSYQVCHDLAQRYSELLKTAKVSRQWHTLRRQRAPRLTLAHSSRSKGSE